MISIDQLRAISAARLQDAIVLLDNDRLDSAAYLCGYAVELALKARICITLNWEGFPQTRGEFEGFLEFQNPQTRFVAYPLWSGATNQSGAASRVVRG